MKSNFIKSIIVVAICILGISIFANAMERSGPVEDYGSVAQEIVELRQQSERAQDAGMIDRAKEIRNQIQNLIQERLLQSDAYEVIINRREGLERADENLESLELMLREAEENLEALRQRIEQAWENRERIQEQVMDSELMERLEMQYDRILSRLSGRDVEEQHFNVLDAAAEIREVVDVNLDRIVESYRDMQRHVEELEIENRRLAEENEELRMIIEERD